MARDVLSLVPVSGRPGAAISLFCRRSPGDLAAGASNTLPSRHNVILSEAKNLGSVGERPQQNQARDVSLRST